MHKFSKIIEWGYLALGVVFLVEVFTNWNTDRQKAIVSILFSALAIFMFIFKRRFRKNRTEK
ncbi:hypothetical protein AXE80_02580 [Wenyingzhuangia fucanilytica]|uniref:Uncharacterized protein n=1 Tax=Wenyingzhuangia fucanilytica TaxID=1790137 RepID=A0A1B1Y382_9FLAO|nr:hypothetical protein [Wenyingzhuangia fucanilytica]ANW95236.1 hypothetical protein AXE80_02580 [Wenyingzhuangia fucanilytica]